MTVGHISHQRGIHNSARDKETTIDSIPSSNRWSNGKNKPRDRNILITLHELLTRQIDGLASSSRVSA